MVTANRELRAVMEQMIEKEVRRLAAEADICIFAVYDPARGDAGPVEFNTYDRRELGAIDLDVRLDFEGVGVWYIVYRDGEVFRSKKVLLKIEDGRFVHGQVGNFEGYWEEFPQYVAEDRWVQAVLSKGTANDVPHQSPDEMRFGAV